MADTNAQEKVIFIEFYQRRRHGRLMPWEVVTCRDGYCHYYDCGQTKYGDATYHMSGGGPYTPDPTYGVVGHEVTGPWWAAPGISAPAKGGRRVLRLPRYLRSLPEEYAIGRES